MSDLKIPTQVLDEIRQVTDAYLQNDLSFEAALKDLRVVAERHGLDWLGLGSKQNYISEQVCCSERYLMADIAMREAAICARATTPSGYFMLIQIAAQSIRHSVA
jgi:hypothetical protein